MPKKKPTTEVAEVVQPTATPAPMQGQSVEELIGMAIREKANVDVMERILNMRREMKAEWAKEQYILAMAQLQAQLPIIKKTKLVKTKDGSDAYRYAPLDSIILQTKSMIQKNGFSYSTEVDTTKPGIVKATCVITHVAGHTERYEMEVPLGSKTAIMSDTQVVAAASSFAKRYAFCNGFGIMTSDEDVDGKNVAPEGEVLSDEQKAINADFIRAKKAIENPKASNAALLTLKGNLETSKRYDKKQIEELTGLIKKRLESSAPTA